MAGTARDARLAEASAKLDRVADIIVALAEIAYGRTPEAARAALAAVDSLAEDAREQEAAYIGETFAEAAGDPFPFPGPEGE